MTAPALKLPCGRCGFPRPVLGGLIACSCVGPGFILRRTWTELDAHPQTSNTQALKGNR